MRGADLHRADPRARGAAVLTPPRRGSARGLTLIEILVVLAIIATISGVAIAGSMQLPSARLRGAATMLTGAIKVAYTRATATSRDIRLVMDLDQQKIWLEESSAPMLVQSKDKSATGGADPVTAVEQQAIEEGDRVLKGPPIPKPRFRPIKVYGFGDGQAVQGGKSLGRGVSFRGVQSAHDDSLRSRGRAYLYFWPGGQTERASIQLRIGSGRDETILSLLVSPLTGKVTIKGGAVELEIPTDDDHLSDRTDTGY
ncbi:MAG: prepilin-type N-terminal cleavage/methylation domain-containing protein [Polyangiaceae bacterium]